MGGTWTITITVHSSRRHHFKACSMLFIHSSSHQFAGMPQHPLWIQSVCQIARACSLRPNDQHSFRSPQSLRRLTLLGSRSNQTSITSPKAPDESLLRGGRLPPSRPRTPAAGFKKDVNDPASARQGAEIVQYLSSKNIMLASQHSVSSQHTAPKSTADHQASSE